MSQKVIGFHYTLSVGGSEIESSFNAEPLYFLTQAQNIIPGLEKEIISLNVGDKKTINVPCAEAYGEINEELIAKVQKSQFPDGAQIQVGDQFQLENTEGSPIFQVTGIEGDEVTINGNHPMAGQDLTFDVEIMLSREATQEEIDHGHVHGPDGSHSH
jgi:FKBP-type peptidyl-prolyl cis-trans isomerase SlyD